MGMKMNFISDDEIDRVLGKIGEFKSEPEWRTNFEKKPEKVTPLPQNIPQNLPQNKAQSTVPSHTFSYLLDDAAKKNLEKTFGFESQKAGSLRRIYALGTDLSIIGLLILGFIYGSILSFGSDSFIFSKLSVIERFRSYGVDEVMFWMVALYGILSFLYLFYFETTMGQTPGKMLLNIRIVDESNEKPTVATLAVRLFLFFLIPLSLLGLHNRITKTKIVLG
jgi:uncharacterized RDD family membrane protein YckC